MAARNKERKKCCFICSTINQKVLHYKLIIVQANIRRANGHHAGVFPDENLPQLQAQLLQAVQA